MSNQYIKGDKNTQIYGCNTIHFHLAAYENKAIPSQKTEHIYQQYFTIILLASIGFSHQTIASTNLTSDYYLQSITVLSLFCLFVFAVVLGFIQDRYLTDETPEQ